MKVSHAFILFNSKAAHNYPRCQIIQVNNNNHLWDLLCYSPIQSNRDLITSYFPSYCYPTIKTHQTSRIWYLRPSTALIQSDLPLSLPFNPSPSLPSPPLSLSITRGAFSLSLQSACLIIGPAFERSYSVCPTPRAIILIWRCEIAYNFPWCPPSLGGAILASSFPGPACLTRHIIIRNEEKGTGVYIKKEMLM